MKFQGILVLAASGTIASSSIFASAKNFACTVDIEFITLEEKITPRKDIAVPNVNILKYGIPAIFTERFDMKTEDDVWAHNTEFESYQFQKGDDGEDASTKQGDLAFQVAHAVIEEDSRSLRGADASRNLQMLPRGCYKDPKCVKEFYGKYLSRSRNRVYWSSSKSGMCRLCEEDDDAAAINLDLAALGSDEERVLTLDQISGAASSSLTSLQESPAHKAFEMDFCNELSILKGYSSFKTIRDCQIVFRCRAMTKEEEDSILNVSVLDNRDGLDGVLYSASIASN